MSTVRHRYHGARKGRSITSFTDAQTGIRATMENVAGNAEAIRDWLKIAKDRDTLEIVLETSEAIGRGVYRDAPSQLHDNIRHIVTHLRFRDGQVSIVTSYPLLP